MKRMMAVILFLAMMISSLTGIGSKEIFAAEYTSAQELPLNGQWSSEQWLTDNNEENWYKIVVPQDGEVTVKTMSYTGYIFYNIYNADLSYRIEYGHGYGSETSPDTDTYVYVLSGGTYYIKITGNNGKYKLFASFENYNVTDQGADSYDSPLNLPSNTAVTGAITETDEEDWYRLTVSSPGSYSVKLSTYMYASYRIYNGDLSKEIDHWTYYGSETQPDTANMNCVLSAGTYYIKISGSTGKYILSWEALTQQNCSHDYSKTYVSSTYTQNGYTLHTCSKCGHSYKDSYTSKRTLGSTTLFGVMKKRKAQVSWYSVTDASGYQIRYSTKSNFKKSVKTVTVKGRLKNKKTINKLKRKKRYYFQVRAYKKVGRFTVYGAWSGKKTGKVL